MNRQKAIILKQFNRIWYYKAQNEVLELSTSIFENFEQKYLYYTFVKRETTTAQILIYD